MTHSPETQTPEFYTTEDINNALGNAERTLPRLQQDPSFHLSCVNQGIDPLKDTASLPYWYAMSAYVNERTTTAQENGADPLTMDALRLIAAAPATLLEAHKLSTRSFHDFHDRRHAREITSAFNGQLREFGYRYPETSVKGMTTALLGTTAQVLPSREQRAAATYQMKAHIRGMQHELGFGQILMQANIPCRETSLSEDLKGLDYVLTIGTGAKQRAIGVDVKASLSEIESHGSNQAFAKTADNHLVIYSMIHDSEFADRFFISEQLAQEKAPALIVQLQRAKVLAA